MKKNKKTVSDAKKKKFYEIYFASIFEYLIKVEKRLRDLERKNGIKRKVGRVKK